MRMRTHFLTIFALGFLMTACCPKPPPTLSEAQRTRARQLALDQVAWYQEHPATGRPVDRAVRVASAENAQRGNGLASLQDDESEESTTCHP